MKFNSKIILFCHFLFSFYFSSAQKISSFEGKTKEELFSWSIETDVIEEKQKLRNYLAEKFPNTVEGETSYAWILGAEGYNDKSNEMYLEVIKKYPKPWLAIINTDYLANKDKTDDVVSNYEKLLSNEPSFSNYHGVRNLYFKLQKLDSKATDQKFNYWKQKLGNDIYIFDFIKGIEAEEKKDYKLAESFYVSALSKKSGKDELSLWTSLINIRKDKLFDNEHKTVEDQVEYFVPLIDEAQLHSHKNTVIDKTFASGAYAFVGDFLSDKNSELALQYYDLAFDSYPSYSILAKKLDILFKQGNSILPSLNEAIKAEIILPDNSVLQADIARKYLDLNDPQSAEKYYKLAIKNAVLTKDSLAILILYRPLFMITYILTILSLNHFLFLS